MAASTNDESNQQTSTSQIDSGGNTSSQDKKTENSSTQNNLKKSTDLYPERKGEKVKTSWLKSAFLGEDRYTIDRMKCERRVYSCLQKSPLLKLMLSALKSAGCEVDIHRHISCETCDTSVTGGYDPDLQQVVVCQNVARSESFVQTALAHEFVHMFDFCRAKLDLQNIDHLACTEIRAANLMHCSMASAMLSGTASPFSISKKHAECVKKRAISSILAVRNVSEEEAVQAVERVFTKCYNDLEPVGRRIRRNSLDMEKAYRERYHYGYYD